LLVSVPVVVVLFDQSDFGRPLGPRFVPVSLLVVVGFAVFAGLAEHSAVVVGVVS